MEVTIIRIYGILTIVCLSNLIQICNAQGTPGYLEQSVGMHIMGGTLIGASLNDMQCRDLCLMIPTCLSVDYNSAEQTCWMHATATYCNALVAKAGCTHYKRVTCSTTATANTYMQTLYQFHVLGGTQIAAGVTAAACLTMCTADAACQGVDYDTRTQSCWMHASGTVCSTPVSKPDCWHFRVTACADGTVVSPIAAPTLAPGASPINFPTPTTIPSGWASYAGTNIASGSFQAVLPNGDDCMNLCAGSATCTAFDFNANNGGCWFHDATRKCDSLLSAPVVYHAKKAPVCTVDNAGTPYPIPTALVP